MLQQGLDWRLLMVSQAENEGQRSEKESLRQKLRGTGLGLQGAKSSQWGLSRGMQGEQEEVKAGKCGQVIGSLKATVRRPLVFLSWLSFPGSFTILLSSPVLPKNLILKTSPYRHKGKCSYPIECQSFIQRIFSGLWRLRLKSPWCLFCGNPQ